LLEPPGERMEQNLEIEERQGEGDSLGSLGLAYADLGETRERQR
jgi:hypothetical protein